jgi:ABC-2 type transport system ATP-binding protein
LDGLPIGFGGPVPLGTKKHVGDNRIDRDNMSALLSAHKLTKEYKEVVALDQVSFDLTEGITGILGENGAGKSTAIKIFLGLVQPTSGSATILGENAFESVNVRSKLGYMPEHDCLPSAVSAAEFLTHMAEVSGLPPTRARTRAADTLRHTGLFEERYRPMGGYSTGMKQRVKLGQALVHDPTMVFLDEPTAGLDPVGREEMLALVRKTHREFGISVLFSSHLMSDVERTCDRIIVLQGGHLVQSGDVDQFTKETETVFIEVDSNQDQLVEALQKRGISTRAEGGGLNIEGPDESVYDLIRDALVDAQAPLRRMAPRKGALTELFKREDDGSHTEQ